MKFARLAPVLAVVAALAGCSSPAADPAAEFNAWASNQEFVVSVDSGHLVVDGAIAADQLSSLSSAAADEAVRLGVATPNLIVGNAWAFAVDAGGVNVAAINTLRDNPLLVGGTVFYEPLETDPSYRGGLRATVGSQAGLRDAPADLVAAYASAGGPVEGVPVSAATADGAFVISGLGSVEPDDAINLWQDIAGQVSPLSAHAELLDGGAQRLTLTVASAAEAAIAEGLGAAHPEVELVVSR